MSADADGATRRCASATAVEACVSAGEASAGAPPAAAGSEPAALVAPAPAQSPSARERRPPPLPTFLHYLLGVDASPGGSAEADLSDAWSIAPKRRGVYNLVQVPMRLERLIVFCFCICIDEFLHLFTLLPLRCVYAVGSVVLLAMRRGVCAVARRPPPPAWMYCTATVIDWMHMSMFVFTSAVLASFDISAVYHSIRGQSVVKLYVVFNVMEIFDRLCCSLGVDVLDSLGWTGANAVNYFNSKRRAARLRSLSSRESVVGARPFRGFVLLTRVAVDYVFALVYVCVHASLLLIWVVTLNVAINTQNNALLTLLVSNNFVELKGAVFKSYKVQNLFQIACSDAVERFQLTLFLGVMLVYAEGDRRLLVTWVIIFACEVVVDWIKHAFVTKFNRIPHRAYQQFSMVICHDVVDSKRNSAVRSIGGTGVAKRIGFISLPLGALVVRMAAHWIARLPRLVPVLLFLIMLALKVSLSIGLLGHASRRLKPQSGKSEYELNATTAQDDDEAWYKSLANVGRYEKS
jgi:transmembrane anterior posterior transformation protein 1